ncbi:MAG: ribosome maturation factor RimP [Thermodesulfobacteriota bacterium]
MSENHNIDVINSVKKLTETLLDHGTMELVDIEYRGEGRGRVLRIYIDKDKGVTIDDCAYLSRELSVLLDVNDVIADRYTLEVSSPGLRRPLKKKDDFKRFEGKLVLIKTNESINNRKVFKGILNKCFENHIVMDIDGESYEIPFYEIKKANLEINF